MTNTNNNTNLTKIEKCVDYAKTTVKFKYYIDKNGLKQGLYELFCEDGQLDERCTYKNDDLHGILELFDNQGKFEFSCNYYTK